MEGVVLNALPEQRGFAANFLRESLRHQLQFGLRQIFAIVFGEADPPLR
jgi:hypothetical protein